MTLALMRAFRAADLPPVLHANVSRFCGKWQESPACFFYLAIHAASRQGGYDD
jgi:hypothetical protein